MLISPFPLRAPVCPHLPLSICSLLASLHAPCPSKFADHRPTLRLAGRHSPPLRRPRSPRRYVRLAIVLGPCTEPWSRAVTVSPPFQATRLLAHLLRFVVSDPDRVLYLLRFLVCVPPRVVRLFLCCGAVPGFVSRMFLHLLISRLVFPVLLRVSRPVLPSPSKL